MYIKVHPAIKTRVTGSLPQFTVDTKPTVRHTVA